MKSKLQKTLSFILIWIFVAGLLCGCGSGTNETATSTDDPEASVTPEPTEGTTPTDVPNVKQPGHYEFDPYLVPEIQTEVCGEKMTEAYHNFIDAVLNGETSFACEDKTTYDWMFGQYPYACCPVVERYVQYPEDTVSFENGRGYFAYAVPYEEFKAKYDEFAERITGILNDVLEDDYTDFEKALALYKYCLENFYYDYDLCDKWYDETTSFVPTDEDVSVYRTLTEGMGICQNLSVAYSFLLLQAGVDATVCSGFRDYDGASHQWSFARIDGVYYHIDITYALGTQWLNYFLMTDEHRYEEDGYAAESFSFVNNYNHEFVHKTFSCKDDRFKKLWAVTYDDIDFIHHTITYTEYDENRNAKAITYDYRELTSE